MKTKVKITALEVENEMQAARNASGFVDTVETRIISDLTENAKVTGKIGDKILLVINPMYVHFPFWQRELRISNARNIGENYNAAKWELPKVYLCAGKLYCADGMHRIYGAFLAAMEHVTAELINVSEIEAIELFLTQTTDRRKMSPSDILNAAITMKKPEWVKFQKICHKNNVNIKGDCNNIENAIGTFTPIYDGVTLTKTHPQAFDTILRLLKALQWGEGSYNAKVIRSFKQLFAYYGTEKTCKYVLCKCKGKEYFQNNIVQKCQYATFDFLSEIIENTQPWEIAKFTKRNKCDIVSMLQEAVAN